MTSKTAYPNNIGAVDCVPIALWLRQEDPDRVHVLLQGWTDDLVACAGPHEKQSTRPKPSDDCQTYG